ncbi:MAG: ethylbenzene dehydrogenase-related protein [Anaerolineae bacterium]
MMNRSRLLIPLVVIAAAVLTFYKMPVASSQGLTLVSAKVADDLPLTDPDSALWQEATAVEVPLSAQIIARPILPETNIKAVTVRALHNDDRLAFLVEWADETQNDSTVRVQDFRDAVALQFPLAEGPPFFCMGQEGGNVNIWHWKADWQADIIARQDVDTAYPNMYVDEYTFAEPVSSISVGPADYTDPNYVPAFAVGNLFAAATYNSPVEDLVAGGFGSLTSQPLEAQNVQGYGVWADGQWRVIFSRSLASSEADDANFSPDQVYSIAFAAWDGANEERNGQKSTSQWVSLQFEGGEEVAAESPVTPSTPQAAAQPAEEEDQFPLFWWLIALFLLVTLGVIIWTYFSLPKQTE